MVELHVQCGEAGVHAGGDAVCHRFYGAVHRVVCHTETVGRPEGQEGAEAQCCGGVGLHKCVSDEDSVFLADENLFFGKDYAAYAVCHAGNAFAVEFTNILVTVWTVDAATVAVDTQIERGAVLNHGFVEAREKHMWLVAHPFHGNHQQPVLLAGVASYQRGAVVGPGLVCTQHFFGQRLFQVDEQILIELKITHYGIRVGVVGWFDCQN